MKWQIWAIFAEENEEYQIGEVEIGDEFVELSTIPMGDFVANYLEASIAAFALEELEEQPDIVQMNMVNMTAGHFELRREGAAGDKRFYVKVGGEEDVKAV